jgi:hypothetical protein
MGRITTMCTHHSLNITMRITNSSEKKISWKKNSLQVLKLYFFLQDESLLLAV